MIWNIDQSNQWVFQSEEVERPRLSESRTWSQSEWIPLTEDQTKDRDPTTQHNIMMINMKNRKHGTVKKSKNSLDRTVFTVSEDQSPMSTLYIIANKGNNNYFTLYLKIIFTNKTYEDMDINYKETM